MGNCLSNEHRQQRIHELESSAYSPHKDNQHKYDADNTVMKNKASHNQDDVNTTIPLTPVSLMSSAAQGSPHHQFLSSSPYGNGTEAASTTTENDEQEAETEASPLSLKLAKDHQLHHQHHHSSSLDEDETLLSQSSFLSQSQSSSQQQPVIYSLGADGTRQSSSSLSSPRHRHQQHLEPSSSFNKNTRQGRALQARLQKARYMQMVMNHGNNSTTSSNTGNASSAQPPNQQQAQQKQQQQPPYLQANAPSVSWEESMSIYSEVSSTHSRQSRRSYKNSNSNSSSHHNTAVPLPLSYSMKDNNNNSNHHQNDSDNHSLLSNDDFEASLHQGVVWAEVACDSAVLTTALSRQWPSLDTTITPSMFLAVGTEQGTLTLTELVMEQPAAASDATNSQQQHHQGPQTTNPTFKARLGDTRTLQRQGRIRSVDFSPDGTCLACAGDDGTCAILDNQLAPLGHIDRLDRIYAVQFSPDAQYIAMGGYDDTVAIAHVTSLRIVAEIPVDGLISTLDWSPDGTLLAIGGSDKLCSIVDTHSWRVVHDWKRPAAVTCVKWRDDGRLLAIGSSNIVIVDRDLLQIHKEVAIPASKNRSEKPVRVHDLCWSPGNGHFLVYCASNRTAKLLETKSFSIIQDFRRGHVHAVDWGQHTAIGSGSQKFLAMGGQDKKVLILKAGVSTSYGGGGSSIGDDTSAGGSSYISNRGDWILKDNTFRDIDDSDLGSTASATLDPLVLARPKGDIPKLSGTVNVVAFSRGSKTRPSAFFAAASDDGTVAVRSTIGWSVLCRLEFLNPMTCIAFSNGSRVMACGSTDGKVQIVATAPVWTVATVIDAGAPVTTVAFSKNNERLAIVGNDGFLGLVDPQESFALANEMERESVFTAIEWSSRNFAVGQEDGTVSIYNVVDILHKSFGDVKPVVFTRPTPVRTLTFGYRGRLLAVGGDDGVVAIYSSEKPEWPLVHSISVDFSISRIKWSPTGRHLAIVGHQNKVKVVDTVFWADIEELGAFSSSGRSSSSNTSLCFSQDGKFMAFTTRDHTGSRIVNTVTWELVLDLEGEKEDIPDTANAPNETTSGPVCVPPEGFPDEQGDDEQEFDQASNEADVVMDDDLMDESGAPSNQQMHDHNRDTVSPLSLPPYTMPQSYEHDQANVGGDDDSPFRLTKSSLSQHNVNTGNETYPELAANTEFMPPAPHEVGNPVEPGSNFHQDHSTSMSPAKSQQQPAAVDNDVEFHCSEPGSDAQSLDENAFTLSRSFQDEPLTQRNHEVTNEEPLPLEFYNAKSRDDEDEAEEYQLPIGSDLH